MQQPKRQSTLNNLLINVLIPSLLLMKGAQWLELGALPILLIALSFPIGYGLYDIIFRKKVNVISILGVLNVLMSGLVGVLQLPTEWIAYKEAGIPLLIGLIVWLSNYTSYPLALKLFYNRELFNVDGIEERLSPIQKRMLIKAFKGAGFLLAFSFLFSSVLNFILAKYFIVSPSGTEAFNNELGQMTLYSYVVILVPSLIILLWIFFRLIRTVRELSGLSMKEALRQ